MLEPRAWLSSTWACSCCATAKAASGPEGWERNPGHHQGAALALVSLSERCRPCWSPQSASSVPRLHVKRSSVFLSFVSQWEKNHCFLPTCNKGERKNQGPSCFCFPSQPVAVLGLFYCKGMLKARMHSWALCQSCSCVRQRLPTYVSEQLLLSNEQQLCGFWFFFLLFFCLKAMTEWNTYPISPPSCSAK